MTEPRTVGPHLPPDAASSGLIAREIAVVGIALYASRGYVAKHGLPASATNLQGHTLIKFTPDRRFLPGAAWLEAHDEGTQVAMEVGGISPAKMAALGGIGVCALPCLTATTEESLVRIGPPQVIAQHKVWLVMHPAMKRVARVRAVQMFLEELMASWASVLDGSSGASSA